MLIIFFRSIILYIVVLIVMRLMGKREIGQLQPFELAISIMISEERQFNVPLTVEIRNIRSSSFNINEWCLAMYTEVTGWQCIGNLTETDTQVYDSSL